MGPLSFYTVLRLQRLVELPQARFRAFAIWQNIEGLRRGNTGVSQNALNLFVIDSHFVQSCSGPSPERLPTEPSAVDVFRNIPPRQIIKVERSQHFFVDGLAVIVPPISTLVTRYGVSPVNAATAQTVRAGSRTFSSISATFRCVVRFQPERSFASQGVESISVR
jgi:hypothetical protein